jgi:hypothetical protein
MVVKIKRKEERLVRAAGNLGDFSKRLYFEAQDEITTDDTDQVCHYEDMEKNSPDPVIEACKNSESLKQF